MDEIIFGFSTAKEFNLISASIMKAENTPYSHVYVRFYAPHVDRWLVYQASHNDLHFSSYNNFLRNNTVIHEYKVPVTATQKKHAEQYCIDKLETRYGRLQVVGMGISRLARLWFNKRVKNPLSDGQTTQVCSELAGHVLQILGSDIKDSDLEIEGPKFIEQKVKELIVQLRMFPAQA